jgi:DNA-binding transcriptional ArsR family regulator
LAVDPWKADEILSNRVRLEIVETLLRGKELHISELERRTGKPWGTVAYHLGLLEHEKIVESEYRLGPHHSRAPVKRFFWVNRKRLEAYLRAWEKLPAEVRAQSKRVRA